MSSGFTKKKSYSTIKKKNLYHCIEKEGFVMTLLYICCACLGKSCIKLEDLDCYNKCVKAANCCCKPTEISFSNTK